MMPRPRAQVPIPVEQDPFHRSELENGLVRLLNATIPPGDATLLHTHSHDNVCISWTEASIWTESELGERRESTEKAGRVSSNADFSRTPRAHRVGNRGRTPYRFSCIEILAKGQGTKKNALLAGEPHGFHEVLDNDHVVVYRIELAPGAGTGRHRYLRPAIFLRPPDGAFEWIEQGTERELSNPSDARNAASVYVIVLR